MKRVTESHSLDAFIPEIKRQFVITKWGSGTETHELGKRANVPLCEAEYRKSYLE